MDVKKAALAIFVSSLLLCGSLYLYLPLAFLLSSDIFLLIYLPVIVFSVFIWVVAPEQLPDFLKTTGIPIGIFVSLFLFVSDFNASLEPEAFIPAVIKQFMAIFHGCLISALGHLIPSSDREPDRQTITVQKRGSLALSLLFPIHCALVTQIDIALYWSWEPFLLFLSPLPLLVLRKSIDEKMRLMIKCMVMVMLGAALISIIAYLNTISDRAGVGPAMAFGILGLLYGSYAILVVTWNIERSSANIQAMIRANWHCLEVFGLYILLIYAPPSIIEGL